jgi:hypothetical protein
MFSDNIHMLYISTEINRQNVQLGKHLLYVIKITQLEIKSHFGSQCYAKLCKYSAVEIT